jgi:hypothetical protein
VPQAGAVEPSASLEILSAPRVDVAPPATPELPKAPARQAPAVPVAVPSTATPLRDASAPGL